MLQRLLSRARAGGPGSLPAAGALALFALWVAGFYWAPSDSEGRSRLLSALFYFGVLPALAATAAARARAVAREASVARAAILFAALLAAGAAMTVGPQEQAAAQVLRHALATAALVAGGAALVTPEAREAIERVVLLAAGTAAAASLLLLAAGRSLDGRALLPVHEDHPNNWGARLGVAAVVALGRLASRRGRAAASLLALGAVLPTLFLTRSRAALVATAAGAAVVLVARRDGRAVRAGAALLLASAAAVALASPHAVERLLSRGDAGRAHIWGELLDRSAGHRLLGVGSTARDDVAFPKGDWDFPDGWTAATAHGTFVGTLYFGGVVALLVLLVLLALAFRAALARGTGPDPLLAGLLAHAVAWGLFDGRGGLTEPSDVSWLVVWLPVALAAAAEVNAIPGARPEEVPESPAVPTGGRVLSLAAFGTAALLAAVRLLDLSAGTDEPWAFRQLDTAYTVRWIAGHGSDLLRSVSPWFGEGGGGAVPLTEALAALGLRLAGGSVLGARLVVLLLFVAAAYPVARLARRLAGRRAAAFAAAALLALPLGFAGSTALLPYGAPLLLASIGALLALRGLGRRAPVSLAAASATLALATLAAPRFLVPWLPLLLAAGGRRRRAGRALALLVLPALAGAFVLLRPSVPGAPPPDLSFLRGATWSAADGRGPELPLAAGSLLWRVQHLGDALVADLAGPALLAAALVGALASFPRGRRRALLPAAGVLLHLLLLVARRPGFPDAELLAIAPAVALLAAAGGAWLAAGTGRRPAERAASLVVLCVVLSSGLPARGRVRPASDPLALAVAASTRDVPPGSLALVLWRGPHGRGPHEVYAGGRGSWTVPPEAFTGAALERLASVGLRRLAVVSRAPADGSFGSRPLLEAPIDGRGTKVRVYRVGPGGVVPDAAKRRAAASFRFQVARNCGFVTSKSFSPGAS